MGEDDKMTNKSLITLTKKYNPYNINHFDMPYSEILFYPALDALEFYLKNISSIKNIKKENKREFKYFKELVKQNIELGKNILETRDLHLKKQMIRELYKQYGEILIFVEEIPG